MSTRICIALRAAVFFGLTIGAPMAAHAVTLDADTQKRLGVRTEVLRTSNAATSVAGVAQVLDVVPLVRLNAELAVASATAAASSADAERLQRLHDDDGNVSLRALESARATAAVDQSRLAALHAELRGSWGSGLSELGAVARGKLVDALAAGTVVLLRVESLTASAMAPRVAQVVMSDQSSRRAEVLGTFPQAGSGAGTAWLARASGAGLAVGMARPAHIETTARIAGVLVPRDAVVRWNGLPWIYIAGEKGEFERHGLGDAQPRSDGWLVTSGLNAGVAVVVRGAAAVLSAETLGGDDAETEAEAE